MSRRANARAKAGLRHQGSCEGRHKVGRGDKLFEWDPYTLPIIAEKRRYGEIRRSGQWHSRARRDGRCHWHDPENCHRLAAAPKGNELKPEIIVLDEDGEPVRNDAGNPLTYPMSVDAILSIDDGPRHQGG